MSVGLLWNGRIRAQKTPKRQVRACTVYHRSRLEKLGPLWPGPGR